MTNILFKICLSSFFIFVCLTGCKKKNIDNDPLIGGDLKIILLGNFTPKTVVMEPNGFAKINFIGRDGTYSFNLNRIDANTHWSKLVKSQKDVTPLKIYVTRETEIVRIE